MNLPPLENIVLKNVYLKLDGGVNEFRADVPEEPQDYHEAFVYGRILPALGIYFRHVNGLVLDDVTISSYRNDAREKLVFNDVNFKINCLIA